MMTPRMVHCTSRINIMSRVQCSRVLKEGYLMASVGDSRPCQKAVFEKASIHNVSGDVCCP